MPLKLHQEGDASFSGLASGMEDFTARLPGDPEHPLANTLRNPFPELGILTLARMLREGAFEDPDVERSVRTYLVGMARMSDGEFMLDNPGRSNHEPISSTEQGYVEYGTPLRYSR